MPDDPNRPSEPPRDSNGNPIPPPPYGAPPPRPLPGNPPPPSFGGPAPGGQSGAQQYDQNTQGEQKYDLAGNPLPSAGGQPLGQPAPYGMPPPGPAPAWPPPPAGPYGQSSPNPYGQPGAYPVQVNGSQILIMGIVSFFCLSIILGPMAYVQGNNALAAIDRGEADPAQRGNVAAGRICGLISGILGVLGIVVYAVIIFGTLASNHH